MAIAHLPPGEGSNSPPATVYLSSEGNSPPNNQASGCLPTLAIAHLPLGEESNSLLGAVNLPSEDVSSSQAIVLLPQGKKTIPPRLLLSLYTGRETAPLNPLGEPGQGKVNPQGRQAR